MSDTFDKLRDALAGRYELKRKVGEGGMATVYLAFDPKHKRDVAIKALRSELSATIGTERFHREIEVAARLQHPHILPVYDSGQTAGVLYYVMPYVQGESLKEYAARYPVPNTEALRIVREVASALDYAHREGVVHRDIKPANILISQGHAVVADFGIARAVRSTGSEGLTSVGMAVGTPWYMSPEQATADPNVDGRSDIYSLACVLFELLEGKPPFDGDTAQAVIAKTISSPVPEMARLQGQVPNAVPQAIRRALAKDPKERFQTAAEFGDALDIGTGEFVGGASPTLKRWMGAVAAVVLVGIGLLVVLRPSDASVAAGADVVAVLPFDVSGAGPELGEGMVNLLSTNLNAAGPISTVDARTVLQRWRARGGETGLDLEGSLQVGRDANAGSVLLGSVVAVGDGVRLSAEMYTTGGTELARVQIEGSANNVFQLVDSLSLEILRAIWRSNEPVPSFDVAALTTGSLEAVRAYMRGMLHFRHGQWDSAVTAFRQAVDVDSTFALAQLALSEGYGWAGQHGSQLQIEANAKAFRHSDRLPPRERLLVQAYHLNRQGEPSALDSIKRFTERYATDPRGWYALGDFQYHGMTDRVLSPEELLEPFDRAVARDSSMVAALVHPMELSLFSGDRARFERYLEVNERAGGDDRGYPLVAKMVWGTPEEVNAAVDSMFARGGPSDFAVATAVVHNPSVAPQIMDAYRPMMERPDVGYSYQYLVSQIALLVGDLDRVDSLAIMLDRTSPGELSALGPLVRILAVLGGVADPSYAEPAIAKLAEIQGERIGRFMRALFALTEGDAPTARRLMDGLELESEERGHRLRALKAWASVLEGDTIYGIQELRAATDSLGVGNLGGSQLDNTFRLVLARVLAARPETRAEGLNMLRYGFDVRNAPELYTLRLLTLADALETTGDYEGAAIALSDFIDMWQNAHPSLQPRVDAARSRLERLNARQN